MPESSSICLLWSREIWMFARCIAVHGDSEVTLSEPWTFAVDIPERGNPLQRPTQKLWVYIMVGNKALWGKACCIDMEAYWCSSNQNWQKSGQKYLSCTFGFLCLLRTSLLCVEALVRCVVGPDQPAHRRGVFYLITSGSGPCSGSNLVGTVDLHYFSNLLDLTRFKQKLPFTESNFECVRIHCFKRWHLLVIKTLHGLGLSLFIQTHTLCSDR